jgi:hypothetical protein
MGQNNKETVGFLEKEYVSTAAQLRAGSEWWPDSTITYTAAGEKSSKTIYTYDTEGNRTYTTYDWKGNQWVKSDSDPIATLNPTVHFTASDVYYKEYQSVAIFYYPRPKASGAIIGNVSYPEALSIRCNPVYDSNGNLTKVDFIIYETARPDNLTLWRSYTITYNKGNQPILIEGYNDSGNLDFKVTYEYNSNGNLTFFEQSELNYSTNQWVSWEKYTATDGLITEEYLNNGALTKTLTQSGSDGHTSMQQFFTWTANKWYLTHYTIYYPNTLAPMLATAGNNPVNNTNQGSFGLNFNATADSIANGSFVAHLPDGFTLDSINTSLTKTFDNFNLVITQQDSNSYLFEIKSKTTRSATFLSDETGKTLAHIAYTVDSQAKYGTYDITVSHILFETPGGNAIVEPALTIPVSLNRWGTSIETVAVSDIQLYPNPAKNDLFIKSDFPIERIEIYNPSGLRVLVNDNFTGKTNISKLKDGLYLIRIYTEGAIFTKKIIVKK